MDNQSKPFQTNKLGALASSIIIILILRYFDKSINDTEGGLLAIICYLSCRLHDVEKYLLPKPKENEEE